MSADARSPRSEERSDAGTGPADRPSQPGNEEHQGTGGDAWRDERTDRVEQRENQESPARWHSPAPMGNPETRTAASFSHTGEAAGHVVSGGPYSASEPITASHEPAPGALEMAQNASVDAADQPDDIAQRSTPIRPDSEASTAPDRPHEVIDTHQPMMTQDYYPTIPPVDHRPCTMPTFDGPPDREQAVQGTVGDCGIISTLGAVAGHRPDAITNAITDHGNGTYDVTLHTTAPSTPSDPVAKPTGDTITYRISNELPFSLTEHGEPLAGARPDTCAWPAILEKTIAAEDQTWDTVKHADWERDWQADAHYGTKSLVDAERRQEGLPPSPDTPPLGYNRIDLGSTPYERADLLAELTGEEAEVRSLPDQRNGLQALLDEFRGQLDDGKPVLVGSRGPLDRELPPFQHFAFGHAYEVTKVDGNMLHLRNPWGEAYNPAPMDVQTFLEYYRRYNSDGSRSGEYTTIK